MRCVDCPYHSRLYGQDWCDIGNVPKRISVADVKKDVPCGKLERKQKRYSMETFDCSEVEICTDYNKLLE